MQWIPTYKNDVTTQVQMLDETVFILSKVNTIVKSMNPAIRPISMSK